MSATAIDTHRIVKRLVQAGVSDEQAEAVTDVVREMTESDRAALMTKAHFATFHVATDKMKHEVQQWLTVIVAIQTVFYLALMKLGLAH